MLSQPDVEIFSPVSHKRKARTYSSAIIDGRNERRNARKKIADEDFNIRWLNNDVTQEELEASARKKELQKIANDEYKASGKKPNRSAESIVNKLILDGARTKKKGADSNLEVDAQT